MRAVTISLFSLLALTGCASIVDGTNQSLSVQTMASGQSVDGAQCELDSNKGTWFVSTPGTVTVHRSYDALNVKCTKDGYQPGLVTVNSSTKAMAAGNLIFGGVIGAGVDIGTGAAYDYPTLITVPLQAAGPVASSAPAGSVVAEASK